MPTHVTILGAGAWGTAVALVLAQNPQHRVTLWSARPENAGEMQARRENVRLLPGVPIPESIHLTADVGDALRKIDLLVAGVPTVHLRGVMTRLAPAMPADVPILSLAKGIETTTFCRPTEILREVLGPRPLAVLSGPSHAEEVAHGLPTTLAVASDDPSLARGIQQCFTTERFRVYTNFDLLGVELAGALKNVMGIAAGINDGLGFGDNSKSALLTRGLAEMARFGVALGAEAATFWGLAGMGDLVTTCISRHGRNRAVGLHLAEGRSLSEIQSASATVAEGVYTTRSVHEKAGRMGIPMPITSEVYRVLYEGKDPRSAVDDLMRRESRSEKERTERKP